MRYEAVGVLDETGVRGRSLVPALEFQDLNEERSRVRMIKCPVEKHHLLSFYSASIGLGAVESHRAIFSVMADAVMTGEAAELLGTTPPTVRTLLNRGLLTGRQVRRSTGFVWLVDASSIQKYKREHGDFRKRTRPSRLDRLEAELAALRTALTDSERLQPGKGSAGDAERERDDLRGTVVTLRDALARTHTVAELQREAEAERSAIIEHLQAATAAGERVDVLRRRAIYELEEAVAATARPGHLADPATTES